MPDTTRTFIAVAVPDALTPKLDRLQQQLAGELPQVRPALGHPHHVTLAFLGDVANPDLNAVCRAAADEAAALDPFELTLEGLGVFPNPARPTTLWTAVGGPGVEALKALQSALAKAVARLRYPADGKRFHPHVTLGRFKARRGEPVDARLLGNLLSHYKTWHAGPFAVSEAVVFASTLTPDGPVYAPLGRAPLRGGKE
jgi:2'-5' RNA ligase